MSYNILLYGATGFSGRLIAAEGKERGMSRHQPNGDCRMILAARDAPALLRVANKNGMEFRIFALNHPDTVRRSLDGIDVVINAAGPFAFTAAPLARAALEAGCHYVDINGEIDVYRELDDLALKAAHRSIAMVSGAGTWAAASDVLLDLALKEVSQRQPSIKSRGLGAVRIATSQVMDFSRGSAVTAARLLREQVTVVRTTKAGKMVICHEPVGKLERTFDFARPPDKQRAAQKKPDLRIASAVNLIDTLTAKHTAERHGLTVQAIEAYVQMGTVGRFAYQVGGMLSSLSALPAVRVLMEAQLSLLLPEGPSQQEMEVGRHVIVLEVEDVYRTRIIDWRLETPHVYRLTAQLVVAIAKSIAPRRDREKMGWTTPAYALDAVQVGVGGLRGCTLDRRRV